MYTSLAQMFVDGNGWATFDYYSWPFYSMFVAATAKLLFIDVELAAYTFNTLLVISLSLAFVSIVSELSNNDYRTLLIATVLILLLPSISKYRSFIIRDFGYLSCYLWSFYFLLRFCSSFKKTYLIAWLGFAAVSCLFRFEGILFVLITPYFLFLFANNVVPHRKKILTVLSLVIAATSLALLFWYINDKYQDSLEVARLNGQDVANLSDFFLANIRARLGTSDITFINFFGLILSNSKDVFYETIRRMAIFYFLFSVYAYYKKLVLTEPLQHNIWCVYLISNVVMLIGFSLSNNFIVSRYTMATVLTLLILTPFAINHFWKAAERSSKAKKIMFGFVITLLILVAIEALDIKTNKLYIKNSGQWLAQNIGKDETVYSNNKLVPYYAGRSVEANLAHLYDFPTLLMFLKTHQLHNYDYVTIVYNKDNIAQDVTRQALSFRFGLPVHYLCEETRCAFTFQTKPKS